MLRQQHGDVSVRLGILFLLLASCGGQVAGNDAGSSDAGSERVDFDGSVTPCSAGAAMLCGSVCGDSCPRQPDGTGCQQLGDNDGSALSICDTFDGGIQWAADCTECSDGHLCVSTTSEPDGLVPSYRFDSMVCADVRFAEMYALNGRDDLARYADRGAYTGAPLPPPPASCPSIPGIQLCGGACGDCPAGYVCTGRSPLHPYSLCINDWRFGHPSLPPPTCIGSADAGATCYDGNDKFRCLTFKVDDASQPIADQYSVCVDKSICLAAAAGYPGGASCTGTAFP